LKGFAFKLRFYRRNRLRSKAFRSFESLSTKGTCGVGNHDLVSQTSIMLAGFACQPTQASGFIYLGSLHKYHLA
jgi:hypothetical protein